MQVVLYRSVTHCTYPDESFTYRYGFQPIHAEESSRDDHLASWTDDSGTEPFVVIETPEGCRIIETEDGWELEVPDQPCGLDAAGVYVLARRGCLGLLVVEELHAESGRRSWARD